MPRRDDLKKLIENKSRRLQILRERQALSGLGTDPGVLIEIQDIQAEISELQETLQALEEEEKAQSHRTVESHNLNSDSEAPLGSQQSIFETVQNVGGLGERTGEETLELESPYGTMHPNSKFYISRVTDGDCWTSLGKNHGVTLLVQASRQMGKSSLIVRMLDQAKKQLDKQIAYIDFQKFPEQYLEDEKSFLIEFCAMISENLDLSEERDRYKEINRYWRRDGTNTSKCSRYLSDYIIPRIKSSFILAMDEVERMIASPFRTNFFGMLRTWHNNRAVDEDFRKITLFLSSALEPYLLIDNPYQSPFNVAELILLQDFTLPEVAKLNRLYQAPLNQAEIDALVALIGGHPFLIRLALDHVASGKADVKTLLDRAIDDRGPFGIHLGHQLLRVSEKPELKQTLIRIFEDGTCAEDRTFHELKGFGLIKRAGKAVVPRNELYTRYFAERLNV